MAKPVYNPVIGDALTRQYEQQGRQQLELDQSIVPVAIVSDSARNVQPPIVRSAASMLEVSAVAGERATFRFEVPPGTIAVINTVTVLADSSSYLDLSVDQTLPGFASIGTVAFTEGRLGNAGQIPAARLSGGTQAGAIANVIFRREFGASGVGFNTAFNLVVGGATQGQYGFVTIQMDAVNTDFSLSLNWDEYAVRSS